ncbi:MAG: Uma2 family endonuclease, partial [Symploca sp. SIO2E6]|nr:Uma2 family endonuclease [Symploca sp. SIO2E6]
QQAKEQERIRAILAEDARDRERQAKEREQQAKEQERLAKEQERLAKEQERRRADNAEVTIQQLRDRLLKLGVDPDSLS